MFSAKNSNSGIHTEPFVNLFLLDIRLFVQFYHEILNTLTEEYPIVNGSQMVLILRFFVFVFF